MKSVQGDIVGNHAHHKQLKLHYDKKVCLSYCANIEVLDLSHSAETLVIVNSNYHYLFLVLIILYIY